VITTSSLSGCGVAEGNAVELARGVIVFVAVDV
jgi:hypothetical protein